MTVAVWRVWGGKGEGHMTRIASCGGAKLRSNSSNSNVRRRRSDRGVLLGERASFLLLPIHCCFFFAI